MSNPFVKCTDVNDRPITDEIGRFVYYNTDTGAYFVLQNDENEDPNVSDGDGTAQYNCTGDEPDKSVDSTNISEASNDTKFSNGMTLTLIESVKAKLKWLNDKSHCKKNVWERIAMEMASKGCFKNLNKITAGEKCHQRWRNLEKMYHTHNKYIKSTGKGKKKTPLYYEEMHDIIGDRHSSEPVLVLDSMDISKIDNETVSLSSSISDQDNCSYSAKDTLIEHNKRSAKNNKTEDVGEEAVNDSEIQKSPPNKCAKKLRETGQSIFSNVKTSVRPNKSNLIEVLKELNNKDIEIQQESFKKLESYLKHQNELKERELNQRESFLLLMQQCVAAENKGKKSKKRVRSSDDSD